MEHLVRTSYAEEDVKILLKDLSGQMEAMSAEEREANIQNGVHYSEMLPLEYEPTTEYMKIYEQALEGLSDKTAEALACISEILYKKHKGTFVIVSLARAGLPVGILIKRYIKYKYNIDLPHYGISIIRGRGIDENAMEYIYNQHGKSIGVKHFQFVDGWVGKGAISNILIEACNKLNIKDNKWLGLSPELAVLADPSNTTKLCGTHEDFLIPSACLNSTVSGLVSRTILNDTLIGDNDFHGAVYFEHMEDADRSYEFIESVERYMRKYANNTFEEKDITGETGIETVRKLQSLYSIQDINFIKPGVGETTRVLLRRVPWKVLIDPRADREELAHILTLCKDKQVPIEEIQIGSYRACGIIKDLHADL